MTDETESSREDPVADGGSESLAGVSDDAAPFRRTESHRSGKRGEPGETKTEPNTKHELLLEVVRRAPLLRALQSGTADANGLVESTRMSRSTVHRATNSLEELDIVENTNDEYRLTSLGQIVAEETKEFDTRIRTALSLEQFLNSVDVDESWIPVEYFTDAKITRREPRQPHTTIHRIIELLETFDDLRMFSTVISPVYVDVGYREMMDGMRIQAIFDREILDLMLSEYPEKAHETVATGNFDLYVHDGLPFELFLFEDRMGMAAHNENGNAEILVECADSAAIEWAETLYATHLSEADSLTLPDR